LTAVASHGVCLFVTVVTVGDAKVAASAGVERLSLCVCVCVCLCVAVAAAELIDCQYTADCGRLHEAGYDSFITGLSLITMINHLGTIRTCDTVRPN